MLIGAFAAFEGRTDMNNMWKMYDELIAGVPEGPVVEEIVMGTVWTYIRAGQYAGVALTVNVTSIPASFSGSFKGRSLRDIAAGAKSWNFMEASAGMAAINAYYNTVENMKRLGADGLENLKGGYEERKKKNSFDNPEESMKGKKVAIIGHFPNIEKKLGEICEMSILERAVSAGDYPDSACEFILPEQDFVYITGMTFINKTLTRLLQICGENAEVCVVGPSSPVVPLLFEYGIDSIGGFCVTDPELVKEMVSQGRRDIFSGGIMVSLNSEN